MSKRNSIVRRISIEMDFAILKKKEQLEDNFNIPLDYTKVSEKIGKVIKKMPPEEFFKL